MATISTQRSHRPNINPNLVVGKAAKPALSREEQETVAKAIESLRRALKTRYDNKADMYLSEAFRLVRAANRSRLS